MVDVLVMVLYVVNFKIILTYINNLDHIDDVGMVDVLTMPTCGIWLSINWFFILRHLLTADAIVL